jgi:hypothetical protein
MRSAWSPARSMSFDTLFDVLANCLLALPTDFTIAWGSTLGRCLGSGTPRTVLRRVRFLITRPPATPAAAAPTATAGPFALLATSLIVSVMPLLLARPFEVAGVAARLFALLPLARVVRLLPLAVPVLRVARLLELDVLRVCDARFFAVLGEREALRLAVDPERAPVALPPDVARAVLARRPDGFDVVFRWDSAIPHSSLA